ncbi:hypothetical protein INT46_004324 [Mucor plumbeus]|uniref:Uncharacterized protein n=1 Tax=Mucor plumbeus TaxID=97098 RepID=A0A8H7QJM0_9FUNG|nr:hypothetical protein INT46_004324 [Mucor plumbeus]
MPPDRTARRLPLPRPYPAPPAIPYPSTEITAILNQPIKNVYFHKSSMPVAIANIQENAAGPTFHLPGFIY